MRAAAVAVALLALCQAAAGSRYCQPVNTTRGVELPRIPESFQTRIEMNIVTKNQTQEVEEYLDGARGNRRIRIFQKNGETDDYIFVNGTGQIMVVLNNLYCVVVNRSLTDIDLLLGINGKVVGSASQVLRFAKEFGLEYRNRTTIRGVLVDYWYSCQQWQERKAEFEVHWYFSASSWGTPYTRNLPVRAEVKGEAGEIGGYRRQFHIVYDFVFFREGLSVPDTIFQTPDGIHCDKRAQLRQPPKLPEVLSYSQEVLVHDPQLSVVRYGNVVYDSAQKLVKYQYREPAEQLRPPFYSVGSMTVIQDFGTGVSYFIDDFIGNCTDRALGAGSFGAHGGTDKGHPGWRLVEMRSPMQLFGIDDRYVFTGSRTERGVPVDRYIAARPEFKVKGREDLNFTFEYKFLDPRVSELVVGRGKISEGTNIPVQLRISNYKKGLEEDDPTMNYREEYNFYNFDTQLGPDASQDFDRIQPRELDVTRCYAKHERKNIVIRFLNGDVFEKYIRNAESLFVRRATQALAASNLGLVNPLRVQRVRLDHDENFVYFVFTMLDVPHPYAQFHRLPGSNRYVERVDRALTTGTELDCLRRCNSAVDPACNSVAFCPGSRAGGNCLLSSSFDSNTSNIDPSHPCAVFMRPSSVQRPGWLELSLEDAFTLLVKAVSAGRVQVEMERPTRPGEPRDVWNVTAVDVEQFEVRPSVDQALVSRFLYKFTVESAVGMRNTEQPLDAVSIDQCAETCLTSSEFDCKSFTFCYGQGLCLLHKESPSESPEQKQPRGRCNLYDRNELSMFTKEPGVSRAEGANLDFVLAADPRSCARTCAGRSQCRSFDFCDLGAGSSLCYLSASHRLDGVSNGTISANCTHYSRSFTADFHQDFVVKQPDLSAFPSSFGRLNLDACSRRCAEQFGDRCNGFYFCKPAEGTDSQCVIHEPGIAKVTAPGGAALPECAYYRREYELNGNAWVQRNSRVAPGAGSSGVSALNLVLVALVLAVIGCVLGAGLVLGLLRLRAARQASGEEPAVQYQR